MDISLEKIIPADIEVERLILGYILASGVLDFDIDQKDLYLESHRKILCAIKEILESGNSPDLVTVISKLKDSDGVECAGGIAYIAGLSSGIPVGRNGIPKQYVEILKQKSALRALISATSEAMTRAYSNEPFNDIVSGLSSVIDQQQALMDSGAGPVPMNQSINETYKEIEAIVTARKSGVSDGVQTGFKEMDRMIPAGLKKDELMVVGGRPGQGKTSLILCMIACMAETGKRILFFSIEMGRIRIVMKLLSLVSGVPLVNMTAGFISKEEWVKLIDAASKMSNWKVWIDDSTGIQVSDMRSRIRRIQEPLDLVAMDYIQLVQVPKHLQRAPETEKIGYISTQLKFLQKTIKVPFLCAAQLNRSTEKRKGGKPQLSDLRQSGQIEQDADIVALIHRDDADEDGMGTSEIIIAKQRNGPTGEFSLAWDGKCAKFSNLWTGE